MVSDASPGSADPKMNKTFVHTAHTYSELARTQDGYFKHPHPTIIDGDIVVGQRLVFGWFWGCGTSDTRLARRKLGKKTHTTTMAAAVVPRLPWCPPPGAAAHNNQPTCCATSLCR
jgi:hypothetical protein